MSFVSTFGQGWYGERACQSILTAAVGSTRLCCRNKGQGPQRDAQRVDARPDIALGCTHHATQISETCSIRAECLLKYQTGKTHLIIPHIFLPRQTTYPVNLPWHLSSRPGG